VEVVYRLVENTASLLEVLYMNDVVKNHVSVDHVTGALIRRHFLHAVEKEVQRADDFGTDLSLLSLSVDGLEEHSARYGKDAPEVILAEVARVIRGNLRSYDVLGRQDDEHFGMLLVNTAGTEASLWAEKIRKAIASHIVTLGDKSLSVTISIGVCGLVDGMRAEDLLSGAGQVLDNATEGGGNVVRVF
jgi:diguanylate cyclase (GGDEF)-like protein